VDQIQTLVNLENVQEIPELVTHNIIIPLHTIPKDKAWSVLYEDDSILVESADNSIWWDNIDWKKVKQINIMGIIIIPPFKSISFCREAIAIYGENSKPVAICCNITYETNILKLRFSLLKEI